MSLKKLNKKEVDAYLKDIEVRKNSSITSYPYQKELEELDSGDAVLLTLSNWKKGKIMKRGKEEKPKDSMVAFLKNRLKDDYEIKVVNRVSELKDVKKLDKVNGGFRKDSDGNIITERKRVYTDTEIIISKL